MPHTIKPEYRNEWLAPPRQHIDYRVSTTGDLVLPGITDAMIAAQIDWNRPIYTCCVCEEQHNWNHGWAIYGSIIDEDNGHGWVTCSDACRLKLGTPTGKSPYFNITFPNQINVEHSAKPVPALPPSDRPPRPPSEEALAVPEVAEEVVADGRLAA